MKWAEVAALYRYPVKSMLGERLTSVEITDRGLTGDRRFALVDEETGRIAGAKSPRLWRELLRCTGPTAQVDADTVQFGSASPPSTFFDFAPVHLITVSTLARIAALSPRGTAEAARYRPNLVIVTGDGEPPPQ